jgi:hypothetical protein
LASVVAALLAVGLRLGHFDRTCGLAGTGTSHGHGDLARPRFDRRGRGTDVSLTAGDTGDRLPDDLSVGKGEESWAVVRHHSKALGFVGDAL